MIFNIQRFSTHDGDGVRTVVFYKGCTLRCMWCSNPEGQSFAPELMYDERSCNRFGTCVEAGNGKLSFSHDGSLAIDRKAVADVLQFADTCPSRALTVSGRKMSSQAIFEKIKKDFAYYHRSGGGVTLSGGEPLAQEEELDELLRLIRVEGIPVSVETSLHVPWEKAEKRLLLIDTFLADLKHTDEKKFRKFTGGSARLIMDNFEKLAEANAKVIMRITVVPGFNDRENEIKPMIDFASSLRNVHEIHLIPFHTYGEQKYRMLGRESPYGYFATVNNETFENHETYAIARGLMVKTG